MIFLGPWLLLFLLLPFLFMLLFFNLATFSFARLGLSPEGAVLFFLACLLGSVINLPVSRRRVVTTPRATIPFFVFYYPPVVQEQTICVNVGGALLPTGLSLYLLATRAPLIPSLAAVGVVALVTKVLARPITGVGITMPAFVPPLLAAVCALALSPQNPAAVAYVSGALGTLLGADLLNWGAIRRLGAQAVSIGGAGVFDGIFLVGVVAAFLA
ncbi:MAG: DUF1614 domain-containing protein [Moorellales bacterium]